MEIPWTADRVARACNLWRIGFSAEQIALELGGISRSGVGSKLARIGMTKAEKPRRTQARVQTRVNAVAVNHNREVRKFDLAVVAKAAAPSPEPLLISLFNLKFYHCRWPIDGPNNSISYCGLNKEFGSYCGYHDKMAHVASAPRRRLV